jgi:hypothetical protein
MSSTHALNPYFFFDIVQRNAWLFSCCQGGEAYLEIMLYLYAYASITPFFNHVFIYTFISKSLAHAIPDYNWMPVRAAESAVATKAPQPLVVPPSEYL